MMSSPTLTAEQVGAIETNGLVRSDEEAEVYFHRYYDRWEALAENVTEERTIDPAAPVEFVEYGAECWRALAFVQGQKYHAEVSGTARGRARLAALGCQPRIAAKTERNAHAPVAR